MASCNVFFFYFLHFILKLAELFTACDVFWWSISKIMKLNNSNFILYFSQWSNNNEMISVATYVCWFYPGFYWHSWCATELMQFCVRTVFGFLMNFCLLLAMPRILNKYECLMSLKIWCNKKLFLVTNSNADLCTTTHQNIARARALRQNGSKSFILKQFYWSAFSVLTALACIHWIRKSHYMSRMSALMHN